MNASSNLNFFLYSLKCIGIIVGGICGVIGILGKEKIYNETRISSPIIGGSETVEKYLSRHGKVLLFFTITGALVALGAQLFEMGKSQREHEESQRHTQDQLHLAQQSLDKLQEQGMLAQITLEQIAHVVTRFEDLEVHAVIEVPAKYFVLTKLIPEDVRSNFLDKNFSFPTPASIIETNGEIDVFSSTMGYFSRTNGELFTFLIAEGIHGLNASVPTSLQSLEDAKVYNSSIKPEKAKLLRFLRSPKVTLKIWNGDQQFMADPADFFASTYKSNEITIDYLYPNDVFRINLRTTYTGSNWIHNYKVSSLPDLDRACVTLSFENYPMGRLELQKTSSTNTSDNPLIFSAASLDIAVNGIPVHGNLQSRSPDDPNKIIARMPEKEQFIPRAFGNLSRSAHAEMLERIKAFNAVQRIRVLTNVVSKPVFPLIGN